MVAQTARTPRTRKPAQQVIVEVKPLDVHAGFWAALSSDQSTWYLLDLRLHTCSCPAGERGFTGVKVDKYFGTKLPPVCASLGCYVTDDGKRFYCINPACQKHLQRETKHTRRGNPKKQTFVYFRCPRCDSRSVEMRVLLNRYVCRTCRYNWQS